MKIALTADLHLTTRADHPERYAALEYILSQCLATEIPTIIIAGDLFDASRQNYAEFEAVCKRKEYSVIQILVIPGNHDPSLSSSQITAPNLRIFSKPETVHLDSSDTVFFFLPYQKGRTMGEYIAAHVSYLPKNEWVLVSHGDWLESLREANPYESGFYMPLSRRDLSVYQPAKVFLGHIHAPLDREPIYYTGSPCGLDISETGPRRFLIYDTQSNVVESRRVESEVIYYDEQLTIFPLEDEVNYLRQSAQEIIRKWGMVPYDKVRLRLKVRGFSSDREQLVGTLKECFAQFTFYKDGEPDISAVSSSSDPDRAALAEAVRQQISRRTWPDGPDDPSPDEILFAALEIIYGGK